MSILNANDPGDSGQVIRLQHILDRVIDSATKRYKAAYEIRHLHALACSKKRVHIYVLFATDEGRETFSEDEFRKYLLAEMARCNPSTCFDDIEIVFELELDKKVASMSMNENDLAWADEAYARASKNAKEASRQLDVVCRSVKRRFSSVCPLHDIYLLPQIDVTFRAYVFLEKNEDVDACEKSGIVEEIKEFIYDELERLGRGNRSEITVAFEFDSDENVASNYGRDYFLRLR